MCFILNIIKHNTTFYQVIFQYDATTLSHLFIKIYTIRIIGIHSESIFMYKKILSN